MSRHLYYGISLSSKPSWQRCSRGLQLSLHGEGYSAATPQTFFKLYCRTVFFFTRCSLCETSPSFVLRSSAARLGAPCNRRYTPPTPPAKSSPRSYPPTKKQESLFPLDSQGTSLPSSLLTWMSPKTLSPRDTLAPMSPSAPPICFTP